MFDKCYKCCYKCYVGFFAVAVIIFTSMFITSGCMLNDNVHNKLHASVINDNGSVEIYMCPADNCRGVLADILGSAEMYIHCAFYNLNSPYLENILANKSQDVEVEIVTNKDRYSKRGLMHNKFCIVDGETVITGSANPTASLETDSNNLLVVHSAAIASNYDDEFHELAEGVFGRGNKSLFPKVNLSGVLIESYFCPDDRCEERVAEQLMKAEKSIEFMTFSFTSKRLGTLLQHRKANGVKVAGIFDKSQIGRYSRYRELGGFVAGTHGRMHHKVFIIDRKIVVTGSYNPTTNGDKFNDENILILHSEDISAKYAEEFEKIIGRLA